MKERSDIEDGDHGVPTLYGYLRSFPARAFQSICREVRVESFDPARGEWLLSLDADCLEATLDRLNDKTGKSFPDHRATVKALRSVDPDEVASMAREISAQEYDEGGFGGSECPFQRTNGMHNACRSCPVSGRMTTAIKSGGEVEVESFGADDRPPVKGRDESKDMAASWERTHGEGVR